MRRENFLNITACFNRSIDSSLEIKLNLEKGVQIDFSLVLGKFLFFFQEIESLEIFLAISFILNGSFIHFLIETIAFNFLDGEN